MPNKRVTIWKGWGGKTTVELTIDGEGFGVLDAAAKRAFTQGQCHSFAIAMHTLTGWPIKGIGSFCEGDERFSPSHCVVYDPRNRKYYDVRGVYRKPHGWRVLNSHISPQRARTLKNYLRPNVAVAMPFAKSLMKRLAL